ncbi:hypothetical protein D3C73_812310 [compost metagenome]
MANDPQWEHDKIVWMAVGATFLAARQGDDPFLAYPVTTAKMTEILGADLFKQLVRHPAHPLLMENRDRRLAAEKVFGILVAEAHEKSLSAVGDWHKAVDVVQDVKDTLGSMYYAVRHMSTYRDYSVEAGLQSARNYLM